MKNNKVRIRTSIEYGEHYKGVKNSGEVLTVPDESYTIEEILDKFTKGINLDLTLNGQYTDTDDFDDVDERTYLNDLTDIEDIETSMAARRSRAKAKVRKPAEKSQELAEDSTQVDSKP